MKKTPFLSSPFPVLNQSLLVWEAKVRVFISPASVTEEAKLDCINHLKHKLANIQSHPSFLGRARDLQGKHKRFRENFCL